MNPAKSIQVPTLGFVILDRAAKVPLAGGIARGDCRSSSGYPNDAAKITNNFTLYTLNFTP